MCSVFSGLGCRLVNKRVASLIFRDSEVAPHFHVKRVGYLDSGCHGGSNGMCFVMIEKMGMLMFLDV